MLPDILTQVGPYPVVFKGCHEGNRFSGLTERPIEGVVCHTMGGWLTGCDSHFWTPGVLASANFGVSFEGVIHQYVRLWSEAPYANGVAVENARKVAVMKAEIRALSEKYKWISQNKWTFSIEHEDGAKQSQITDHPKQFDASTWLSATILASLPSDKRQTFGHYMFDGIDRPYCPGWSTDTWAAYDARVKELIASIEAGATPTLPLTVPAAEPVAVPQGPVSREEFEALKAFANSMYDSHHPWLTQLHAKVWDEYGPRLERLDGLAANNVMIDVDQGRQLEELRRKVGL